MAGDELAGSHFPYLGLLCGALLLSLWTTGTEPATRRRRQRGGHITFQRRTGEPLLRVGQWHGVEESSGVGMGGIVVDFDRVTELAHLTEVHDQHIVADGPHDTEVMGDEDDSQIELGLQFLDQVENLGLDRHVERGDRLITNQESGPRANARAMATRCACPPDS